MHRTQNNFTAERMSQTPTKQVPESGMNINLDYKKLLFDFLQYWWLFLITIPLAIGSVYMLHRYVPEVFSAEIKILMEERGTDMPQTNMMEGFGLTPEMRSVDNQIALLTSWDMVYEAINNLDFNVSYFAQGNVKTTEVYPASNWRIEFDTLHDQLINTKFYIEQLNKKEFLLKFTDNGEGIYNYYSRASRGSAVSNTTTTTYKFGDWIETDNYKFRVICNGCNFSSGSEQYFLFNHPNALAGKYVGKLRAYKKSETSSIVHLGITGENKAKNIKFLNTLTQVFIQNNLEKKNQIATNTIHFIESQLLTIKDSLSETGTELSNFRTKNKIQDIGSKADFLFTRMQEFELQLEEIQITKDYYLYLNQYLLNDTIDNSIIAPAIYKIDNQLISTQIQNLMTINSERLAIKKPLGDTQNPYAYTMDSQFELAKNTLIQSIQSQNEILETQVLRLKNEKSKVEANLYGLPDTERKLMGIQRKFELSNEVYTFLLRKHSEAQIQKASNTPDHQVLEAARNGGMVSPNIQGNYKKAFIIGLLLPLLFLVIRQLLDKKISSIEDVEKMTSYPVIGQVLHSSRPEYNIVSSRPQSSVTESFRRVRTRLEYLIGDVKSPVVTISSSIPGEGKTFCSLNLASVFALSGKKTVLVGFDMRKPGLSRMLNLNGVDGTSEYLINKVNLEDILLENNHGIDNLTIISSGVNPPNPSELISSPRTDQLLEELRERFDIIILDSPPMGIVSDPYLLARKSDTLVFMARHNHSVKDIFAHTLQHATHEGINNIGVLLNDLDIKKMRNRVTNGYGSGYGYGYNYSQGYYTEE